MSRNDSPTGEDVTIACELSPEEAAHREEWVRSELLPHLEGVAEREAGYAFTFDGSSTAYEAVATFVQLESRCCPFATFEIELPPGAEEIEVRVTGPDGTRELLHEGFVSRLEAEGLA